MSAVRSRHRPPLSLVSKIDREARGIAAAVAGHEKAGGAVDGPNKLVGDVENLKTQRGRVAEHIEQIASAKSDDDGLRHLERIEAVRRLRRLVLDLGVDGKTMPTRRAVLNIEA